MPLDHFFAELLGLILLLVSIAMLARRATFMSVINEVMDNRAVMFLVAILSLVVGLVIVLVHNNWTGSFLTIFITLLGWLFVIRAVLLLFLPQHDLRKIITFIKPQQHYYLLALVALIVGAYLTYAGFWRMGSIMM